MRRRRFGNAGEPWEVAMERLRALPANPTEEQTAHALATKEKWRAEAFAYKRGPNGKILEYPWR